jgi:hypothetical protein
LLLGAQVLVYGEVTQFTKVYAGIYFQIGVGAKIKIVDSQTGQTLWEDAYDTRFHEGDIPRESDFNCSFFSKDRY